jgi:hypothetical protein
VLVYTTGTVYWCYDVGVPNLILYADGTAYSSGPTDCGPHLDRRDDGTLRTYRLSPERVQHILDRLKRLGVFSTPTAGTTNVTDSGYVSIQAFYNGERYDAVSYADGDSPIATGAEVLNSVISGLHGGPVLSPAGYVLTAQPIEYRKGLEDDAADWTLYPKIDLGLLGVSPRSEKLVLPLQYGRSLRALGKPFTYIDVEQPVPDCRDCPFGLFYQVYWRPASPID